MLQALCQMPSDDPVLYLDLQGVNLSRKGSISVMALFAEPKRHVYLIDVQELGELAFETESAGITLRKILESPDIPKIFFDVRDDADALFGHFNIRLGGVSDVQLMENAARGEHNRFFLHGLLRCMELDAAVEEPQREAWLTTKEKGLHMFSSKNGGTFEHFLKRPLSQDCQEYCVHQVKWLPLIRSTYASQLHVGWNVAVALESRKRVEAAQKSSFVPQRSRRLVAPFGGKRPPGFFFRRPGAKATKTKADLPQQDGVIDKAAPMMKGEADGAAAETAIAETATAETATKAEDEVPRQDGAMDETAKGLSATPVPA